MFLQDVEYLYTTSGIRTDYEIYYYKCKTCGKTKEILIDNKMEKHTITHLLGTYPK